jgi:hypothetical protein
MRESGASGEHGASEAETEETEAGAEAGREPEQADPAPPGKERGSPAERGPDVKYQE